MPASFIWLIKVERDSWVLFSERSKNEADSVRTEGEIQISLSFSLSPFLPLPNRGNNLGITQSHLSGQAGVNEDGGTPNISGPSSFVKRFGFSLQTTFPLNTTDPDGKGQVSYRCAGLVLICGAVDLVD